MDLIEHKPFFSETLERLADAIDLTEAQYKDAIKKYDAVTKFLCSEGSKLRHYDPELLPQGSFRLGTAVRPINDEDEFDVDVTLRLKINLPDIQRRIKSEVGSQLRSDAQYSEMLEEKQRCWRLNYSDSSRFHLDVVPSVPENFKWLLEMKIPQRYAEQAIRITDNERTDYDVRTSDWPKSNTEGFALWFLDIMKEHADRVRMDLKKSMMLENIQDVPFYKVRTPLQRAVQIMKRHRDQRFLGDDDKPASIIITTLAAKSYESMLRTNTLPTDFYDVLMRLLDLMPTFIERRNGENWIENPVDKSENFADRWKKKHPIRERNFYQWMNWAKDDFTQAYRKQNIQSSLDYLKKSMGSRAINEAIRATTGGSSVLIDESTKTPLRFNVSHRQEPIWPLVNTHSVKISARYKDSQGWQWFDLNHDVLPKQYEIMFTASTDVLGDISVFWQVVNTGIEARNANDLRGGIFAAKSFGRGGLRHKERTSYAGTHWIECFIVQNGICVARSGEYVVRIR